MKKFTIDGYEYHCDGLGKPIEGVFIQLDGGDEKPIVRKNEYVRDSKAMFEVADSKGYYPYSRTWNLNNILPVTWTNNPHLNTK